MYSVRSSTEHSIRTPYISLRTQASFGPDSIWGNDVRRTNKLVSDIDSELSLAAQQRLPLACLLGTISVNNATTIFDVAGKFDTPQFKLAMCY
jgi:hypothetical protein